MEDYLEVIYNLLENSQFARSKDIAKQLNVAKPSVTGALKALSKKGLINYKPYGYVTLTELGTKNASNIAKKHDVIENFLTNVLGIDKDTAKTTACRLEHCLGPKITTKLRHLTDFAQTRNENGKSFAEIFKKYCNDKIN